MAAETKVGSVNDFSALARLKADVGRQDPQAVKQAARQFEALFLQMMLKSMRDAGSAFAETKDRSYEEMFDQQIALELAQSDSIGIADLLMRQMDFGAKPVESHDPSDVSRFDGRASAASIPPMASPMSVSQVASPMTSRSDTALTELGEASNTVGIGTSAMMSTRRREDFAPEDAESFVAEIWPLARKAAEELGIDPRGIVAQAALETGWGEKLIRDHSGVSGNNLFGLKAGPDWPGERVSVVSLEYEGAAFVPRQAAFRAYPTLAEGFAGYTDFLKTSPRYADAIERGKSAYDFAAELQSAGYATDPAYEEKLHRILSSDRFAEYINNVAVAE